MSDADASLNPSSEPSLPVPADPPIDGELVNDGAFDIGSLLGGGPGGGLDMGALLSSAMEMQQQLADAQQQAMLQTVEGQAGGGMVKIEVTGGLEFRSVTIDPEVVDPSDIEMLQDLVLAALHDAAARIQDLQSSSMSGVGGLPGLGGDALGGFDLGGLFGGSELADDDDFEDEDDDDSDDDSDDEAGGTPLR